jgi:hypothetical protein
MLPGQLTLAGIEADTMRELLQRKAAKPLRATKPQAPADHGLFSDDALQSDLLDMPMFLD